MANNARTRRCLIVERHTWETGGRQQQLQFVLKTARDFFGSGRRDRSVTVRVRLSPAAREPAFQRTITISREYRNGTRRTNRFPEMGAMPHSFIFFQESGEPNVYDVWWQTDMAIVAARYQNWVQGGNTQYGRGRLSTIVPAPVSRPLDSLR